MINLNKSTAPTEIIERDAIVKLVKLVVILCADVTSTGGLIRLEALTAGHSVRIFVR